MTGKEYGPIAVRVRMTSDAGYLRGRRGWLVASTCAGKLSYVLIPGAGKRRGYVHRVSTQLTRLGWL